ncbi:Ig-like domain-containing protein [Archangium lansingense]|uniref:Ig-like domain-containing protein n=1 Tax=Archangium lansingense TaxID=2995310 RepID=A0ABT4A9H5_9BACT|nr:Ig-like domain-containing protein [Archangium lansinium]MCY1078280.1 Ig-like domain-containing protein [Archangium lansinium]
MRILVTLLAAGLVLASCERASVEPASEPEAPTRTVKSFVAGSRLMKTGKAVPGRYIVALDKAALAEAPVGELAHQLSALHGATLDQVYSRSLHGFSATMTQEDALRLSNDPRVRYVEEDGEASLASTQTNAPWGLDRIDQGTLPLDQLYRYNSIGSGVHAYVIDSGIRLTHAEFGGRAVHGFSAIADGNGSNDCNGHGTHVASTLGGATSGVAKGVTLHSVRVVGCSPSFTWSQVIAGIDWVTANHVKPAVATLSLAGEAMQAVDDAVAASINAGVFYAVAAGNGSKDACTVSPARVPAAMTVAATNRSDAWASSFSNHGSCVDLFAPGEGITAAWYSDDTTLAALSGTSMASAHVAGVAALFLESHSQATPEQVSAELTSSATPGTISSLPANSPNLLLYARRCTGNGPSPSQVVLTSPSTGSTLSGTVTLTATATDDERVTRVEFFLGDRSLGWDASAPYELVWNSALAGNGAAVLTARAYDTNCNEAVSAPVNVTLSNAGNAAFSSTWGAPECVAPSNKCDSAWLLEGRGDLGPEVHAPNTLGSACADGTEGTYGASPSLERLVVTRIDGTAFVAGKEVTVQATVRASTNAANEVLDLYVSPDVSNPSWTRIASLKLPYQGAGTWTHSTRYLLPAGGRHILRGVYHSGSGTASACSSDPLADHDDLVIEVGTQPDTTPPFVNISSPAGGSTVSKVVEVSVDASDNFGVNRVELYDGSTLIATSGHSPSTPYKLSWDTRTVPNGNRTLTARAYDLAGNVSTSAPITVRLDNDLVPPTVSISTPAEGATVRQTITISGSVSDNRGVTYVSVVVDDRTINYFSGYYFPLSSFQTGWDTRLFTNGPKVIHVNAFDAAGNVTERTLNVLVDNDFTPPQISITSPFDGAAVSGIVSFEAAASDNQGIADVEFFVDGERLWAADTTAPYAVSWNSADVLNGTHTLTARARDQAPYYTTSAPITVEVRNPGSAQFDPVLKVPRCDAVEARCDTRTLVRGRATLRPELNMPNTLDGCLDGTSGYYQYDESIERVRVIREDGTPLAAGKRVRIEADVWVYIATSNLLDLYYTTSVSGAPVWTYLTTVKPTATGLQTLSADYVLPASGQQAIRAAFRNSGATTGPCQGGSKTDVDDLVFAVGAQEPDSLPPTQVAITSPSNGASVSGTVTVTASASDDLGVAAVDFFDGQTLIETDTQPPYSVNWNSRSAPNGSRTLTVRARDLAGNEVTSQPVTVTTHNDLVVPVVSLTAPAAGARVGSSVAVSALATDDQGVTRVEFYDGLSLIGYDFYAPFTTTWIPRVTQTSNRTLTAWAYDAAGNVAISAPVDVVAVVLESTPPTVSLSAPANGAWLFGTVTLSADATDESGVSKVEFLVDGVVIRTHTAAPPYVYSWDSRGKADGSHTLSVRATDLHGNVATSTVVSVMLDNTAPIVTFTSPANEAALVGMVYLQANASDSVGVTRVDFLVDGVLLASDATAPYSVDWDTGLWLNGNHTLVARAHDVAGNMTSSAQVTVFTNQPGGSGYDYYLRVPECYSQGSVCDTTGYVKGRQSGEFYGGSSTLGNTCADGADSLEAQKINRIKVSSVNGGLLTQGQLARVEVHVNVLDTAMDALDLFSAGDANHPSWTYLTTLRPSATGSQVLSAEYVLPAGRLQAVRAQFRVGGNSGSACSTGPLDDHDDLAFAVDSGPTVELTMSPGYATVKGTVWLFARAVDEQEVTRVEFYVDGTLISTSTSPPVYSANWNTANLPDGVHSFTAKAYDITGLSNSSPPIVVTTDNTPPGATLLSPVPGTYVRGTAQLEAAISANEPVTKVEFYANWSLVGTVTSPPYTLSWNTTGLGGGTYLLVAKAYDSIGNAGSSTGVSVTVDNTVPTTAISAPAQNALVGGTVQVSATASDSQGVERVEFYVDGTLIGTDTSAPYTLSWNTTTVTDEAHVLTSRAYDFAGNVRTSTAVVVNIDNTPPDAVLTSPAPGSSLRGSVMLEASASDSSGVTKVEFYDGTTLIGTDTTASYVLSWNTVGVGEGVHTLSVKAYDSAGKVRTSAGVSVTIDNTAPTTALSAPAQNAAVRGTVPVSATASDNIGVAQVEFYADGTLLGSATTAPYAVSWDTTAWANGSVTLTTRAYDAVGNVTVSAGVAVTVDHTAPTVAITSPTNGASLFLSATLQASASDNRGVTQVVFYDGANVIGTDTTAPYSLSWSVLLVAKGNHTLTAKAYDAAGNVTTSAPVTVKVN